ncbi:MAG: alanine racemase [Deltaproteobacteria bacterium]|nr:alanine racemase [Deltaproteobacteria bacterium]
MRLTDLPTPALLVDLDVLEANIAHASARARDLEVAWRPHGKTHKCPEIARMQLLAGAVGLTASTLAEVRAFAAAGVQDLTWALPVPVSRVGEALDLAADLAVGGGALHLVADHPDAVTTLDAAARSASVLLKVDCGAHRAGVDPLDPAAIDLAVAIATAPHLRFAGVLAHAGHAYRCRSRAEAAGVAAHERDETVAFADRLRRAGLEVPVVSVGSTPTVAAVDHLVGVTEIRPGNSVYHDAFQVAVGTCGLADCAVSVMATVIGRHPARDAAVLDAGTLALSADPGPRHVDPDCGFGVLLDLAGAPIPAFRLVGLTQEHAVVHGPLTHGLLPWGSRVRVIPNHACLAVACHERIHGVRRGRVEVTWSLARGW